MLDIHILHEIIKNGYRQFDRSSTLRTLLSLYTSEGGSLREVSIYPLYF